MIFLHNKGCRLGVLALALASWAGLSQAQTNWAWTAGKQTNDGSIVVKSVKSPGATMTARKNPTGSAVDMRQNAATQPPVLLKSGNGNRWSLYYADRTAGLP